jgi:hypothetical protein
MVPTLPRRSNDLVTLLQFVNDRFPYRAAPALVGELLELIDLRPVHPTGT